MGKDSRRRAALVTSIAVVCLFYVGAALTNGKTLRSSSNPQGFHAAIADALLRGHLDVLPAPKGLLALTDPYDPVANQAFRIGGYHDFALYGRRMFTATGPTTAVLLYLPARLLGLGYLSAALATLLCGICGFVATVGLFGECRKRFFPALPLWGELAVVFGLGLGSPVLWLISIGRQYENTIACGYLLATAGLYFLVSALRDPARPITWRLAAAGTALAAAVGARPHLASASLFVVVAVVAMLRSRPRPGATPWHPVLSLVLPYLLVGALLALYNYARFHSFTEFGTSYQLAGMNMPAYPIYRASYLGANVVDYLLLPPRFGSSWPFVRLATNTFANNPLRHGHEPIAGILWLFPLVPVGLWAGAARCRTAGRELIRLFLVLGVLFGFLALLAVSLPFNSSTMRYTVDFAPVLALVASVGWAYAFERDHRRRGLRRLLATMWLGAVAASALIGLALILTPCRGTGSC